MDPDISHLPKPPIGDPCNNCGLCCRITTCATGSYVLKLVDRWGDRAPGSCPALIIEDDGRQICGVIAHPKDWISSSRSVTALREAMSLCVGCGLGCDEAGEEIDATARPKLDKVREAFERRYSQADIQRAVRILLT